jgi:molecular chaperone HtpG
MTEEKLTFSADVSRLLDIVAHALYSNRDVFLRELVSNAADACDRLRYEAIRNPALSGADSDLKIRVFRTPEKRQLTVLDNGIGMSRQELIDNLGTIARSGTAAVAEQLQAADDKDKLSLIGQFGVGFYASFMVSKTVQVISRRAGEKETWHWESDGRTGFSVREAAAEEAAQLDGNQGTAVIVHIDNDSSEFLLDEKLRQVIETWSDHIGFPIYLGKPDKDEKQINKAAALWTRPKHDITKEEYTDFYRHIGHGMDEPIMTSHWKAEGKIEYTALLFVPTLRPWDMFNPTRKHAVRLYVRRVFITDNLEGLVYPWLRFVRGVIDSSDLPLNISREMLQHNPVVAKIRSGMTKRILSDMEKLSRDDEAAFGALWAQFGPVIKEGLYDAFEHRDELLQVARFNSTHENKMTSLADYVSRMKPDQDAIYYISGENIDNLRNSPQTEGFRSRGLEVLLFTDTIDDFWLQSVMDYQGKPFKSVTKGNIDLSKFDAGAADDKSPAQKDKKKAENSSLENLVNVLKEELKEDVGDVRATSRLTDSPVCLIAGDNEVDLRMERVLRIHQKYETPSKRVLEINPGHPLIARMAALAAGNANAQTLNDAARLLLDQARIIQGEPVPDPAAFARRMALFMERGLAA